MIWLEAAGLGVLIAVAFAIVDLSHARYLAARETRRGWTASAWSVLGWGAATLGFVVAVRVSMWFLPFEAIGLAVGTRIGVCMDARSDCRGYPSR